MVATLWCQTGVFRVESLHVIEVDLADAAHMDDAVALIDDYARDPMGGGEGLADDVKARLAEGLRAHPTTRIFLARDGEEAVGVAVCFLGFSTFAARPLLNIHDLAVKASYRRRGIGAALIEKAAEAARALDCCKLTLELHAQNEDAQRLYRRMGFEDINYGIHPGPVYFMHRAL